MQIAADTSLACWCGAAHVICWRTASFGLTVCRACATYRIDPPPMMSEAACAQFYQDYYDGPSASAPPPSRFWNVATLEPALLQSGNRAMDVGCGDGTLCAELVHQGWQHVVGADLSAPRVSRARRTHPTISFHDTLFDWPDVAAGSRELVVMDNVIEHILDPLTFLKRLREYVAPQGRLVLITPNMESGHYRLLGRRWTPELAPHAHIYLFTRSSLQRLLEAAGFTTVAAGTFHTPGMPLAESAARLARGDVKGTVWRAVQDAGGAYGKLIGSGPMLYAIASPSERTPARQPLSQSHASDIVKEIHHPASSVSTPEAIATGVSAVVCTYRRPDDLARLLTSMRTQRQRPSALLIVDASPDEDARRSQETLADLESLADRVHYWQVAGALRGLTRQRNFALKHVNTDLVLFLDDDVILEPDCVAQMEAALRSGGRDVAGVGCNSRNELARPSRLWRLRRAMRIVPNLEPGRYWRTGISSPWAFQRPTGVPVEGDWLPGFAMMWRTEVVRAIGFDERMDGYAQGEDLDFSLRARAWGKLLMLGTTPLEHRRSLVARTDSFRLGYMELRNRYEIHRRSLPDRTWRDVARFTYAWALDTLLLARGLALPGRSRAAARQIGGRAKAALDLCLSRVAVR